MISPHDLVDVSPASTRVVRPRSDAIELPDSFLAAATSQAKVGACPHNLYKYPARFAPEFAREAIRNFSQPGDLILDCFNGGGTTGVEAVALGRRAVGYDISSLACFLAKVKMTPLTVHDERRLLAWSQSLGNLNDTAAISAWENADTDDGYYRRNLPPSAHRFFANVIAQLPRLERRRQQRFARIVLLAVGQWALDCKNQLPSVEAMREEYQRQLVASVTAFRRYTWGVAKSLGIPPQALKRQRKIVHASSEKCGAGGAIMPGSVSLVVTSPPYPGVHMLYHRWQLHGRREMPAPFLLADCRDGDGISFYSLGNRKEEGLRTYFARLTRIFTAVRPCLKADALVVQMVAFNNPEWQLPQFLQSMEKAGYQQVLPNGPAASADQNLWRVVPGRRWYAAVNKASAAGKEVVLLHRQI
jgi:DNA modification methylase